MRLCPLQELGFIVVSGYQVEPNAGKYEHCTELRFCPANVNISPYYGVKCIGGQQQRVILSLVVVTTQRQPWNILVSGHNRSATHKVAPIVASRKCRFEKSGVAICKEGRRRTSFCEYTDPQTIISTFITSVLGRKVMVGWSRFLEEITN